MGKARERIKCAVCGRNMYRSTQHKYITTCIDCRLSMQKELKKEADNA